MNSTSDALLTIDEYKHSLLTSIYIRITATNKDDEYSIGLRNGLRIAKAYIDGQEPEYEEVLNNPLTWDELKQMEGKPVWVEADNGQEKFKHWFIIDEFTDSDMPRLQIMWCFYNSFKFWEADLGKTWQAFRKERGSAG